MLSGVDIIDGTPILDVKPYIPVYDFVAPEVRGSVDEFFFMRCWDSSQWRWRGGSARRLSAVSRW